MFVALNIMVNKKLYSALNAYKISAVDYIRDTQPFQCCVHIYISILFAEGLMCAFASRKSRI